MDEPITPLTREQYDARRKRSLAIGWAVAAFAFLFMTVSLIRIGPDNILGRYQEAHQTNQQKRGVSSPVDGKETKLATPSTTARNKIRDTATQDLGKGQ